MSNDAAEPGNPLDVGAGPTVRKVPGCVAMEYYQQATTPCLQEFLSRLRDQEEREEEPEPVIYRTISAIEQELCRRLTGKNEA